MLVLPNPGLYEGGVTDPAIEDTSRELKAVWRKKNHQA